MNKPINPNLRINKYKLWKITHLNKCRYGHLIRKNCPISAVPFEINYVRHSFKYIFFQWIESFNWRWVSNNILLDIYYFVCLMYDNSDKRSQFWVNQLNHKYATTALCKTVHEQNIIVLYYKWSEIQFLSSVNIISYGMRWSTSSWVGLFSLKNEIPFSSTVYFPSQER